MNIQDITTGESWGCRFKVEIMLDTNGKPAKNPQIGQRFQGPGIYEGTGVIKTRDLEHKLVELIDIETSQTHIVPFESIWDIDTVEYVD